MFSFQRAERFGKELVVFIRIIDYLPRGSTASAHIVDGGLGQKFVEIELVSRLSRGISARIEIFAQEI